MSFESNTGMTIQEAFETFHAANPEIYKRFKDLALMAIDIGRTRISFKMIMNVIRWEVFMQTDGHPPTFIGRKLVRFKINNCFESRYARLFIKDYPEHADKVELRELKAN